MAAYLKKNIVSDRGYNNWCKSALALKYLMTALVPFLEEEIQIIFSDVVKQFQRVSLCPGAKLDDLQWPKQKDATFGHKCSGSPIQCNRILALIKNETHSDLDFIHMVKGTDPQLWLHSPLEFAKLFLKEWIRPGLGRFEDFDISAFCQLVKRSKRLKQKVDENLLNQLRDARNRTMHNANMNMSQQDLEEHLDANLYFLKNQDCLNGREEAKQAVKDIEKLRDAERILRDKEAVQVIKEVVLPIIEKKHNYENTMYTEMFKSLNVVCGNIYPGLENIEEEQRRRREEEKQRQRQQEEERQRQQEEERQRTEERREQFKEQFVPQNRQQRLQDGSERTRRNFAGAVLGGMIGTIGGPAGVVIGASAGASLADPIHNLREYITTIRNGSL